MDQPSNQTKIKKKNPRNEAVNLGVYSPSLQTISQIWLTTAFQQFPYTISILG